MSVFTVRLVPTNRASVWATDPTLVDGVSSQMTIDINGPGLSRHRFADGDTFTGSNYYKRYCSVADGGQMSADSAFLHLVTDDNSVWDDHNPTDNSFPLVLDYTLDGDEDYAADNTVDFLSTYGGYAVYTQIVTDGDITVKLNGSDDAELDIDEGQQVLNAGDASLSSLAFKNREETTSNVQVFVTVRNLINNS